MDSFPNRIFEGDAFWIVFAHSSTPRRFSSLSTASNAISSGSTAIVVQPMIAARARIKKGII